jgi:hypothetical protein
MGAEHRNYDGLTLPLETTIFLAIGNNHFLAMKMTMTAGRRGRQTNGRNGTEQILRQRKYQMFFALLFSREPVLFEILMTLVVGIFSLVSAKMSRSAQL